LESRRKSLYKAITYRILSVIATGCISYAITGSVQVAGAIMYFDTIIKLFLFYFHERAWEQGIAKKSKNPKGQEWRKGTLWDKDL